MNSDSANLTRDEQLQQDAMHWHAASSREDCDWEAFTAWLEADASHQRAYDEVALLEDGLARHRKALQQAQDAAIPAPRRLRPWLVSALAAGVLAVVVAIGWRQLPIGSAAQQSWQAQASAREVTLGDGSRILLAPGSSMRVRGRHGNEIQLSGSAYFDVPHDATRQLVVRAGAFEVRDIGTRFEVFGDARALKVAVEDGEVYVGFPGGGGARVVAGQRLLVAGAPPVAEYASIAAEDIAGWRSGRLVLRNEPLSLVTAQVAAYAGVTVTVDESIADRRFSGVLATGDGSELVARLGEIMGVQVQRQGDAVHLSAVEPGR